MSKRSRRILREVLNNSYRLIKKKFIINFSWSKNLNDILNILVKEGYIDGYFYNSEEKNLHVYLKYVRQKPAVELIESGLGKSIRVKGLKLYLNRVMYKDTLILSTSKGIKTGIEALKQSIGGEVLFIIR